MQDLRGSLDWHIANDLQPQQSQDYSYCNLPQIGLLGLAIGYMHSSPRLMIRLIQDIIDNMTIAMRASNV